MCENFLRVLVAYRLLAEALRLLALPEWSLTIVGDGPARNEVEALFVPFGSRVQILGLVDDIIA